jgi:ABC-type dipeptide/oligopeptide/nickel transport system ATPase component
MATAEHGSHAGPTDESPAVLEVDGLRVVYPTRGAEVVAVDDLSFTIHGSEFVGLVGESGSGKSTAALATIGLVRRPGRIVAGRALFAGRDLLEMSEPDLRERRGRDIGLVVQNPQTSLNPLLSVGRQIADVLRAHREVSKRDATDEAVRALAEVGIPDPARRARSFPHQLSGGLRQRAMIALATVNKPRLLIADEPTTGLDVTVQAQILDLLRARVHEAGASVLFITHDLGIVAHYCNRVVVMLHGRLAEEASTARLFTDPQHPYTRRLIASTPERARPNRSTVSPP